MLTVMEDTADRRAAARAAIVVSSDTAFGMGRMVEMRSEERANPRFQIFRDMIAACEWLGVD
jgi:ornithine carbamoyltransferase